MKIKANLLDLTGKLAYNSPMIKNLRLKLNLSQEKLANEIGVSIRTIRNIESGKTISRLVASQLAQWVKETTHQERMATEGLQKK